MPTPKYVERNEVFEIVIYDSVNLFRQTQSGAQRDKKLKSILQYARFGGDEKKNISASSHFLCKMWYRQSPALVYYCDQTS